MKYASTRRRSARSTLMNTFNRRLLPLLGLVCVVGVIAPQPGRAGVSVGVSITLAPPELPVY